MGGVRTESYEMWRAADVGGSKWGQGGERTRINAHHVTFDKVKPERHLLDTLVNAVYTLFGIGEDNVGFLVVACQHALFPHPK